MLLAQLSSKIKLTESVLDSFMKAVVENTNDYNSEEPLTCLIFLFQSQSLDTMRFDVFEKLISLKYFDRQLQQIAQRYNISNFMRAFLKTLVEHSLATEDTSLLEHYLEMKDDLLQVHLHIPFVTKQLFRHFVEFRDQIGDAVPKVLDIIEKRFGPEMDRGLYLCLDDMDDKDEDLVLQFVHLAFKGSKHAFDEELNGTLFLSLQHPEASIRLLAVKRLEKMLSDIDKEEHRSDTHKEKTMTFIRDSLVQLLDDDNNKVLRQILSIESLSKIIDMTTLLDKLSALIEKVFTVAAGGKSKRIKRLVVPALRILLRQEVISQNSSQISSVILPYILEIFSSYPDLIKDLSGSLNLLDHPLTNGLNFGENIGNQPHEFVSKFIDGLARNIARKADSLLPFCNTMVHENRGARVILLSLLKVYQASDDSNARLRLARGVFEISSSGLCKYQCDDSVIDLFSTGRIDEVTNPSELMVLCVAHILTQLKKDHHQIHNRDAAAQSMEDDEEEDSNTLYYEQLLSDIFVSTLSNPSAFDNPDSITIVKSIISDHLKSNTLSFMSQFWSSKIAIVDTLVTERCLSMAAAIVVNSKQDTESLHYLLPSLFVALFSEHYSVRYTAMNCIKAMGMASTAEGSTHMKADHNQNLTLPNNSFKSVISRMVSQKNKFLTNNTYIIDFVANVSDEVAGLVRFALHHVITQHNSPYFQYVLLRSVEKIDTPDKLVICLPLLQSLLHKSGQCVKIDHTRSSKSRKLKLRKNKISQKALTLEEFRLLAILIRDCFVTKTTTLLNNREDRRYWDTFMECITSHRSVCYHGTPLTDIVLSEDDQDSDPTLALNSFVPCVTAISNIGGNMFSALNMKNKKDLFASLCKVIRDSAGNGMVAAVVQDTCRMLPIPSEIVIDVFPDIVESKQPTKDDLTQLTNVLEIVVIMDGITDREQLGKKMFELLSIFLGFDSSNPAVEYAMNLMLLIIFSVAQTMVEVAASPHRGKNIRISKEALASAQDLFDMDIVVKCLQCSAQIRNQAIALIGILTPLLPEVVLMHVVSLLDIVQNTLQKERDSLSFEVVERTILQIVSAAAAEGSMDTVTILDVLINCFDHIPTDRRLPLFSAIIKLISRNKLHVIMFMFLQRFTKTQDHVLFTFACELLLYFKTINQLKCLGRLLEFVRTHLFPSKTESAELSRKQLDLPYDAMEITAHERNDLALCIIRLAAATIENTEFLNELISFEEVNPKSTSQKVLLAISHTLAVLNCTFKHKVKIDSLEQITQSVVSSIQQLLDTLRFVALVKRLLASNDRHIRLKALDILNMKLANPAEKWTIDNEEQKVVLGLLPILKDIVSSKDESYQMIQCAIVGIELIARRFGHMHLKFLATMLPAVCAHLNDSDDNLHLVASSALCVATISAEVGTFAVPHVPLVFKSLMHALRHMSLRYGREVEREHSAFRLSLVYALDLIIRSHVRYVSPYIADIVHILLHDQIVDSTSTNIQHQSSELLNYLVDNVEPRLLMAPVLQAHSSALLSGQQSVTRLLMLVRDILSSLDAETAHNYHPQYLQFFLSLFDTRRVHGDKVDDIDHVEDHIVEAFSAFVLKLNEQLFKPVLLKLVEWSRTPRKQLASDKIEETNSEGVSALAATYQQWDSATTNLRELPHNDRLLIFYKIINNIAGSLKSIFTEFWHFLLDPALEDLKRLNRKTTDSPNEMSDDDDDVSTSDDDDDDDDDDIYAGKKRKRPATFAEDDNDSVYGDDDEEKEEDTSIVMDKRQTKHNTSTEHEIIVCVITALDKLFTYDREEFMSSRTVFEKVLTPLVDQVKNVSMGTLPLSYEQRIAVLAPCLGKLAVAIPHHFWKPLQFAVLQKSQMDSSHIKYAILCVLQEFYEQVGHEFIITLPEMIPYVAEMLDSDDDRIVDRVRVLIEKVENITGENIRQHLK